MAGIAPGNVEKSFWIPSSGGSIFVCHHSPAPRPCPRHVFVMCPPFGEEKNKSQRLYVELARAIAARGNAVYRFDFSGTADSSGSFEKAVLADWQKNLDDVVGLARAEHPDCALGLIGLRFGCALTALASAGATRVRRLIHIAPVIDVPRFLKRTLRGKLVKELLTNGRVNSKRLAGEDGTSQPVIDLDGFPLARRLEQELMGLGVPDGGTLSATNILIVHAARNPKLTEDENALHGHYAKAGAEVSVRKVAAEPYWSVHGIPPFDVIVRTIVDWIGVEGAPEGRNAHHARTGGGAPSPSRHYSIATGDGREIAVDVGGNDARISAVLHVPGGWKGPSDAAVVMLHGWAGYRIGPHQMLVSAAREFCRRGYLAVRIDVRGRGNSGGEVGDTSVQTMREDAGAAVRYLHAHYKPGRLVLLGQCAAGNAILGADEADGFVVWSAPPVDQSIRAKLRKMRFVLRQYLAKASRGETWLKLARGELNSALIREALVGHFRRGAMPAGSGAQQLAGNRLSGKPCLMIYGELDPDAKPARAMLGALCRRAGLATEFRIIRGANHSFYSLAWEKEVIDSTADWLARHFGQHSR